MTWFPAIDETYLSDLRRIRASGGATAEISSYGLLENLLNAIGDGMRAWGCRSLGWGLVMAVLVVAYWRVQRTGTVVSLLVVVIAGLAACDPRTAAEAEYEPTPRMEALEVSTPESTTAQPTASQPERRSRSPRDATPDPRPSVTPSEVATPTPTPTPDPDERRVPPPTSFSGYPCDPYRIDGVKAWIWENTVRWQADGSAVFFSQGPKVYGVAADGAWARAVADASAWINPRLPWHPRVRGDLVVGPMTYFDISPAGDRLVYATCAYLEDVVTESRRPSAELEGFLRLGYDPRYTGTFVPDYELAVVGIEGGPVQRLTRSGRFDNFPVWSPDGTRLAFLAGASVRAAFLMIMSAPGGYTPSIDTGEYILGLHPPQWSPDGTKLAVVGTDDSRHQLAVLTVNADGGDLRRLGRTISGPSWSPDGQRLAFVGRAGDDDGAWDLLTMASNGTEVQRLALAADWAPNYAGGHAILTSLPKYSDGWIPTLAWSPAGDQLLYTCGQRICVVRLDGTPVGRSPLTWLGGKWDASGSVAAWSPDGTHIAVARSVVWHNWQSQGSLPFEPTLYTMAPDGSDVRVLAAYDATGEVRPLGPRPANVHVDVTGCAAGLAVAEPAATPGLVRDCEALLRVQAAWQHEFNWSPDVPIGAWEGVTLGGSPHACASSRSGARCWARSRRR